ncbi:MAG TPA: hypothetical protein VGM25_14810 [Caulobacteraceae bacterium]|jgi:hypothetical protein
MPKLDVGVGDEFPAPEVRLDPEDETVVHHHHYYRRYRRPGRWLFFVLWIMIVTFVFRAIHFAFWGDWGWTRHGYHGYGGWQPLEGMLMGILIIGGLIWMSCWRPGKAWRGDRRPEDGR